MRKCVQGKRLTSIDELCNVYGVYQHGHFMHRDWVLAWQVRYARYEISAGHIYEAIPVNRYDYKAKTALLPVGEKCGHIV